MKSCGEKHPKIWMWWRTMASMTRDYLHKCHNEIHMPDVLQSMQLPKYFKSPEIIKLKNPDLVGKLLSKGLF